jgi:hypothetical protein
VQQVSRLRARKFNAPPFSEHLVEIMTRGDKLISKALTLGFEFRDLCCRVRRVSLNPLELIGVGCLSSFELPDSALRSLQRVSHVKQVGTAFRSDALQTCVGILEHREAPTNRIGGGKLRR